MADAIRLVRPRYVLMENVAALLADGVAFGWILADLAALGFDAEWSVLSACAMGAPHPRNRLFLVAHTNQVDGASRVGTRQELGVSGIAGRPPTSQPRGAEARAWRDRVNRAASAAGSDDRDADGLAPELVAAGGDAVVPQVAEHIGRLIMEAAA
jgi:DNA (cytosine-5)-methyltransferase 1